MPPERELKALVDRPVEALGVEHKSWLDLTEKADKAKLSRAVIAIANHGGGFVVIGMSESNGTLRSTPAPSGMKSITQDSINDAVSRYVGASLHCEMHYVGHTTTKVAHPVVVVPGGFSFPVMAKRGYPGVIDQNRCYIRKPGPKSEDPRTAEEWQQLFTRCLQVRKEEMLDGIRAIVTGIDLNEPQPNAQQELESFCDEARDRWKGLIGNLQNDAPARFIDGWYEMGFSLVGAYPATGDSDLMRRIDKAGSTKLTGWAPFLNLRGPGTTPYPYSNYVEAWLGRPISGDNSFDSAMTSDFWRVSKDGKLYTIRGYEEDSWPDRVKPGSTIDLTIPIWRTAEALLFAARLAQEFDHVDRISIKLRFTGIEGRRLMSIAQPLPLFPGRVYSREDFTSRGTVTVYEAQNNTVETVHSLLRSLYEGFDFFELSIDLVDREIKKLKRSS